MDGDPSSDDDEREEALEEEDEEDVEGIASLKRSCFHAEWEEKKGDRLAIIVFRADTQERMFDTSILLSPSSPVLDLAEAVSVKATVPATPRLFLKDGKALAMHESLEAAGVYDRAEVVAELCQAIVTAGDDGTAKIWNAETGDCERTLCGHTGPVHCAVFSPDCKSVATASADQTAKVWNAATGRCKWTLVGHKDFVHSVEFSPDSRSVVTAGADRTARIWSSRSGVCAMVLRGHACPVIAARFELTGEHVFTADSSSRTRVFNARTGMYAGDSDKHLLVCSRSYSPNGSSVVVAPGDSTALVLNATTHQRELILEGHKGLVHAAAFAGAYPT